MKCEKHKFNSLNTSCPCCEDELESSASERSGSNDLLCCRYNDLSKIIRTIKYEVEAAVKCEAELITPSFAILLLEWCKHAESPVTGVAPGECMTE